MSAANVKLILLPGLDGTGLLFQPLLAALPADINYQVIALSDLHFDDPERQATEIAALSGPGPCIVVAESYAGRVAYELCCQQKMDVRHVIFVASFLSRPSSISRLAKCLPPALLRLNFLPARCSSYILFGSTRQQHLLPLFFNAMAKANVKHLKNRLRRISQLTLPAQTLPLPCTYIRANTDLLVKRQAVKDFQLRFNNVQLVDIDGGHLILQCQPQRCAQVISQVLATAAR